MQDIVPCLRLEYLGLDIEVVCYFDVWKLSMCTNLIKQKFHHDGNDDKATKRSVECDVHWFDKKKLHHHGNDNGATKRSTENKVQ